MNARHLKEVRRIRDGQPNSCAFQFKESLVFEVIGCAGRNHYTVRTSRFLRAHSSFIHLLP
jgi:hypothetical protein